MVEAMLDSVGGGGEGGKQGGRGGSNGSEDYVGGCWGGGQHEHE
jgi:hypothetical protein